MRQAVEQDGVASVRSLAGARGTRRTGSAAGAPGASPSSPAKRAPSALAISRKALRSVIDSAVRARPERRRGSPLGRPCRPPPCPARAAGGATALASCGGAPGAPASAAAAGAPAPRATAAASTAPEAVESCGEALFKALLRGRGCADRHRVVRRRAGRRQKSVRHQGRQAADPKAAEPGKAPVAVVDRHRCELDRHRRRRAADAPQDAKAAPRLLAGQRRRDALATVDHESLEIPEGAADDVGRRLAHHGREIGRDAHDKPGRIGLPDEAHCRTARGERRDGRERIGRHRGGRGRGGRRRMRGGVSRDGGRASRSQAGSGPAAMARRPWPPAARATRRQAQVTSALRKPAANLSRSSLMPVERRKPPRQSQRPASARRAQASPRAPRPWHSTTAPRRRTTTAPPPSPA